jgi:hypothetical protein
MSADFRSPPCWLYPLKPGGERKSAYIRQKMVALIYPNPQAVLKRASKREGFTKPTSTSQLQLDFTKNDFSDE